MTVSELLKRLLAIYPGFDPKASEALAPVYRARLGRSEGPHLEAAFLEVTSEFKPTMRQPFPTAKEFADKLPSAGLHELPSTDRWGPPMRGRGEAHDRNVAALVAGWRTRQGLKIEAARGWRVLNACAAEVQALANLRGWADRPAEIVLTAEQIQLCEDRVTSSERVHRDGPLPSNVDVWEAQMGEAREAVKAGTKPNHFGTPRKMRRAA